MWQQVMAKCFVMLPCDEGFNDVWNAIQEVCVTNFDLTVSRSDYQKDQSIPSQNAHRHTLHHRDFRDSELLLIDITGDNPSSLFEFGYAVAQENKYVIPLTRKKVGDLPVDFRSYMILKYELDEIEEFKINLASRLRAELSKIEDDRDKFQLIKKNDIAQPDFMVQCFSNRDNANLDNVFSMAKKDIKILQTNMSTVVKNYMKDIHSALQLESDLEVSFLALDPESYFAAVRANQLGKDVSEFRSDLRNALLDLHEAFKENSKVEIRIYDDFPTQICYIIDGCIYNCVVSKYQPSRNNCVFLLEDRYPSLHTSFVLHFTSVWRDNRTTRKFTPLNPIIH
jgi:hypothetical protein